MVVAMEIGWGCSSPSFGMSKKRGWGQDQHKLLQLMIGQPSVSDDHQEGQSTTTTTLNLLGGSCSSSTSISQDKQVLEELDMDLPPPKGWEKRLDLKLGKFYYVELSTGKSTYEHPIALSGTRGWDLESELAKFDMKQLVSSQESEELLELKLNSSSSSTSNMNRGVATIQAVQDALKRSFKNHRQDKVRLGMSPTTSTTSSTTSSSSRANCLSSASEKSTSSKYQNHHQLHHKQQLDVDQTSTVEVPKVVLTGCKRCLMYVMLTQSDPRCPKCGTSLGTTEMPLQNDQRKKPRLELVLL